MKKNVFIIVILSILFSCSLINNNQERDPNDIWDWAEIPAIGTKLTYECKEQINNNYYENTWIKELVDTTNYYGVILKWDLMLYTEDIIDTLITVNLVHCYNENINHDSIYQENWITNDFPEEFVLKTPVEDETDIWSYNYKFEIREVDVDKQIKAGYFTDLVKLDILLYQVDVGDAYYCPQLVQIIYFDLDCTEFFYWKKKYELVEWE